MQHRIIGTALISVALLLSASLSAAVENKTGTAGETKASRNAKAAAKVKLVDINSAGKQELKTLQGIGDTEADKIIAGRPYLSKAHLVTRKVIPHGIYEQNKRQIVAIQKPAANKQ